MTPSRIAGHPVHPMLVTIPIGLWVFALVSDLLHRFGARGQSWDSVALYCTGGGVVGAVFAAIPGLIDLISLTDAKIKKLGLAHMAVNLLAVLTFSLSFVLRLGPERGGSVPLWLSVVGVALIGVSGWLGGEMVYVHGVGVERAAAATPSRPGA
jgi:uncharacterized membrane protein